MTASTEIVFTPAEVAKAAELTEADLRRLEPDHFGCPRHWQMHRHGPVYTAAGVVELIEALHREGRAASALCVRAMLDARLHPPSPASPWYREGSMA